MNHFWNTFDCVFHLCHGRASATCGRRTGWLQNHGCLLLVKNQLNVKDCRSVPTSFINHFLLFEHQARALEGEPADELNSAGRQSAILTLLKRYTSDADKFKHYFKVFLQAAMNGTPFESMGGAIIAPKELWAAVAEVRQHCDFPIEPEPLGNPGDTQFHQDMALFMRGGDASDPNEVEFNLVYAKLPDKVYTLVKAAGLYIECWELL